MRTLPRILIVEDESAIAELIAVNLKHNGFQPIWAIDAATAQRELDDVIPDVILLDIGLPKLNGYEAAQQIRRHQDGAGIVLIALTGWGQEEDRRQSKEAGFDHHLTKPVDLVTLRTLLADM